LAEKTFLEQKRVLELITWAPRMVPLELELELELTELLVLMVPEPVLEPLLA